MNSEARRWKETLDAYRYPVSLSDYRFRAEHASWFMQSTGSGDRGETVGFEDRFRRYARCALEPWFEVVFWKLATQYNIRNGTTQRLAKNLTENITAEELWRKCGEYVYCDASQAKARFTDFWLPFGLTTDSIATVATFPAFIDPDRFPMVDTRIAKWVGQEMEKHNATNPTGVRLLRPKFLDGRATVLKMNDFDFMTSWVQWCRQTAQELTRREDGFQWRARDVEMAVFWAWGDKNAKKHPAIDLPPLPPT